MIVIKYDHLVDMSSKIEELIKEETKELDKKLYRKQKDINDTIAAVATHINMMQHAKEQMLNKGLSAEPINIRIEAASAVQQIIFNRLGVSPL